MTVRNRFLILTLLLFCTTPSAFAWRTTTYYIKDSLKYCVREDSSSVMVSVMAVADSVRLPVTEDGTLVIPASLTIEGHTYKVEDIEDYGFHHHPEIKHLVISEGTYSIRERAFELCMNLQSIHFPTTVGWIDASAFWNCSMLTSITVENGNETLDSRDNCNAVIETEDGKLLLGCLRTKIPKGITSIAQGAFLGQKNISDIEIPEDVREIECNAFADCTGLKQIHLPASLEFIGDAAFFGCASLGELCIPASVSEIGERIVANCHRLKQITVSPENKIYDSRNHCNAIIRTKDDCLVAGCGSTSIVDGIRRIGDRAFWGTSITRIYIPSSVTHIEERAFINSRFCSSIEVSPNNPVYNSCNGCDAIIETATGTLVKGCGMTTIPPEVKQIGGYAFYGMPVPKGLVIPEGITAIGTSAFAHCDMYTLTLPASLRRISNGAFSNCTHLETVETDSPELHIGRAAFQFCYSLLAVRMPKATTFSDSEVFRHTPYQEIYEREYGKPIIFAPNSQQHITQ